MQPNPMVHTLTFLPNMGASGPNGPSHLTYPFYDNVTLICTVMEFCRILRGAGGSRNPILGRTHTSLEKIAVVNYIVKVVSSTVIKTLTVITVRHLF